MAVDTSIPENPFTIDASAGDDASSLARAIQEHLDLKQRNAALDGDMPLDRYSVEDPFENHPLFKSEEQARLEETLEGVRGARAAPALPGRARTRRSRAPRSTTASGAARATSTGASDIALRGAPPAPRPAYGSRAVTLRASASTGSPTSPSASVRTSSPARTSCSSTSSSTRRSRARSRARRSRAGARRVLPLRDRPPPPQGGDRARPRGGART